MLMLSNVLNNMFVGEIVMKVKCLLSIECLIQYIEIKISNTHVICYKVIIS